MTTTDELNPHGGLTLPLWVRTGALLALCLLGPPAQAQSPAASPRPLQLVDSTIAQIQAKRDRVLAMMAQLRADVDDINHQISALDAQDGLRPERFVSREGIARMHAGVTATQALVVRRGKLVDDFVAATKEVPGTDIMSVDAKRQLTLAIRDINASLLASYKPLEAAQLDSLKVQLELLAKGEQAQGWLALKDGGLVFQRQQDQDDFQQLQARLQQAQLRVQQAAAPPPELKKQGAPMVVGPLAGARQWHSGP